MARYIDADRFKHNLEKASEKTHLIGGVKGVDVGAVIIALDRQPTADVVEVVRCSECDHFLECGEEGYCIIMMRGMHKYGFCSSAVRKEKT